MPVLFGLVLLPLRIYPMEITTEIHKGSALRNLIASLFLIAKKKKKESGK